MPVHMVVGLGIARFFSIPWYYSVLFSVLPDVDHLFYIHTWRFRQGGFVQARTFLHEVLGLAIWAGIGIIITFFNVEWGRAFLVCISLHLLLDFVDGKSVPFRHIREDWEVEMGGKLWIRVLQQLVIVLIFSILFLTWRDRPFLRW